MALVPFYPGNGPAIAVDVDHISEFPRDVDGYCAFCHGDPCDEEKIDGSLIHEFWESIREHHWIDTCPCCGGRPS